MIRVVRRIIDVIFIVIIVVLSSYYVLRMTNKVAIYEVKTGSMEDGIHVGDYILTYTSKNYNIGDVVTYSSGNYYVTHRIIKKDANKIITKGDANNIEDEEIKLSDIKGKVIYSGGILNIIVKYKYAIVGFMLTIYILTYLLENLEKDKNEE